MNERVIRAALQGVQTGAMMEAALRSELAMRLYVAHFTEYTRSSLNEGGVSGWPVSVAAQAAVAGADCLIAELRRPPKG